jgi:hypothetical protein
MGHRAVTETWRDFQFDHATHAGQHSFSDSGGTASNSSRLPNYLICLSSMMKCSVELGGIPGGGITP